MLYFSRRTSVEIPVAHISSYIFVQFKICVCTGVIEEVVLMEETCLKLLCV